MDDKRFTIKKIPVRVKKKRPFPNTHAHTKKTKPRATVTTENVAITKNS